MNVKQKWSGFTIAALAAGMCFQLVASYAIGLWGARLRTEEWLGAAITIQLAQIDLALSRELDLTEHLLTAQLAAEGARTADAEIAALTRLQQSDPDRFWAWLPDATEATRTSDLRCVEALDRIRREPPPTPTFLLPCRGAVVLVTQAPRAAGRPGILIGHALNENYAADVLDLTGTEIVVFVGDVPVASSFRDTEDRALLPALRASQIARLPEARSVSFGEHRVDLPGYAGYKPAGRARRFQLSRGDPWFVMTHRLHGRADVTVALMVPVAIQTIGTRYTLLLTGTTTLAILLGMGLLVGKIVARFSDPIAALSRSAHAVAEGDLTRAVPVPADPEMREFCETYNRMLAGMRDLLALQKRLARESGQREIATSILHNVGNVLNSVNVSATLALSSARESKVASLRKAVCLIEEHGADLPEFLAADPRGQRLPPYLGKLSVHLLEERDQIVEELTSLVDKIEHIKTIVSTQQRYARVGGGVERCALGDVVDDALRIEATSLQNQRVTIDRRVDPIPEVTIDRHRVLQILTNLLSNARHAIAATNRGHGRIVVRVSESAGEITIRVEDDGVGIPPENLPRIFGYGFTTHETGHGFGLHHSALVARELGGALTGESEGDGRGAAFTLRLATTPRAPGRETTPPLPRAVAPAAALAPAGG